MKNTKNTKANTTAKKTAAKQDEPKVMTYPQAKALTNAIFHANKTKAKLSELIDGLPEEVRGKGMNADNKAKWLEEHGKEPASYNQCKMYAYALLNSKAPYDEVSKLIEQLDKQSGYVRQPKVEETVAKANEQVKKADVAEQLSLLANEDADNATTTA